MELFNVLMSNEYVALFSIITLGLLIGKVRIFNISLGSSAVIFVALVFGHFHYAIPSGVGVLGLILFIYCVGISAGPTFFSAFKKQGKSLIQLSILVVGTAGLSILFLSKFFGIPMELSVGILAGALTSTPALASATDTLQGSGALVSVGYGVAYPFGVLGVVLFVQLLPRFLKKDLKEVEEEKGGKKRKTVIRYFIEVSNEAVIGKKISEIKILSEFPCQISRVFERGRFVPLSYDMILKAKQILLIVGEEENVDLIVGVLGKKSTEISNTQIERERMKVVVTSKEMLGKSLKELELLKRYGVTVTRVNRVDTTFVPSGNTTFEIADVLTVVGEVMDLNVFSKAAGHRVKAAHETNVLSLCIGIMFGIIIGMTPIGHPDVGSFTLGTSGGLLLVSLVLGHWGRIGNVVGRIPLGARHLMTELGLVFFLAHAGVRAGGSFVETVSQYGISLFGIGMTVTVIPLVCGYLAARYIFKISLFEMLGGICGAMTSTPGLGAITSKTDSEIPVISYATAYPVALVFIIIVVQILIAVL